jgi:serine protease
MHRRTTLRIGSATALLALMWSGGTAASAAPKADPVGFVVTVHGSAPSRAAVQKTVGALPVQSVRSIGRGLARVLVRTTRPAAAAARLAASPLIGEATRDRRFSVAATPSPVQVKDQWFSQQWDLWDASSIVRAGGFGVDAPRAWTRTTGSRSVVVAVLDTGVTQHPDVAGASFVPGYDFVSETDGVVTGDGDGWDGDPSDPGDACTDTGTASSWHGTFVTGEIVAQRGSTGVVGQAPGVSVEPVRVLGGCGGSEADSIAAIEWASGGTVDGVPANAHPANVVSMSLGSDTGACSDALQIAVDDAIGRGVTIVAAAGNDATSMADTSPANCAGVVSVVSTTRSGSLSSFSNRGSASITPSIAAPGGSDANPIVGDTWTGARAFSAAGNTGVIGTDQGTSMATPRVSAAIALLLSVQPGLDPADIMQRLAQTATPFPAGSSCTEARCGDGIVNAGDLVGAKRVFLHATATKVVGIAKVGRLLRASAGTWRPAAQQLTYRWLRDGTPIAKATGRTYRLRAKDAGHRIAVRVQAQRADALTASAQSTARRIPR